MADTAEARPSDVFRRRLREAREARGWTAQQLADAAGMYPTVIYKLETGQRKAPTLDEVLALALALDVSPDAFVLPTDNSKVALTAQVVVPADTAREWFAGHNLLVAAADADAGTSWPPEDPTDATRRIEFWRSQRPDRERRARARPGVDHLLLAVDWFVRAAGTAGEGTHAAMRSALESIRREVDRALDELDREDAEGEAG